jgi:hypothetical protein
MSLVLWPAIFAMLEQQNKMNDTKTLGTEDAQALRLVAEKIERSKNIFGSVAGEGYREVLAHEQWEGGDEYLAQQGLIWVTVSADQAQMWNLGQAPLKRYLSVYAGDGKVHVRRKVINTKDARIKELEEQLQASKRDGVPYKALHQDAIGRIILLEQELRQAKAEKEMQRNINSQLTAENAALQKDFHSAQDKYADVCRARGQLQTKVCDLTAAAAEIYHYFLTSPELTTDAQMGKWGAFRRAFGFAAGQGNKAKSDYYTAQAERSEGSTECWRELLPFVDDNHVITAADEMNMFYAGTDVPYVGGTQDGHYCTGRWYAPSMSLGKSFGLARAGFISEGYDTRVRTRSRRPNVVETPAKYRHKTAVQIESCTSVNLGDVFEEGVKAAGGTTK